MINQIVILGRTGFIGAHLERSLSKNHPQIKVIGESFPALDLTQNTNVLRTCFDQNTAVIMCAAVKKQLGDNLENCEKNITMVINVAKILQEKPVQRFIYFSSAEVYGHQDHPPITEETPVQPTSYYGIAKYTAERILQKIMPQNVVILRPPQIYGVGDMPCYGPSGFIQASRDQTPITLWGTGEEKREFIFVEDIVALVEKLIFSRYSGVLNLASGVSYSYQEILEILKDQAQLFPIVISKARTLPKIDFYFNNQAIKNLFPSFKFTSLSEGIKKMNQRENKF